MPAPSELEMIGPQRRVKPGRDCPRIFTYSEKMMGESTYHYPPKETSFG